jgi:signal peptidase II
MNFKNQTFWVVALLGLILDQLTKFGIKQTFELDQSLPLWKGVFHLTYVTNKGAAFSLFAGQGGWLRWLSLLVSLGLIALVVFSPNLSKIEQLGYGFILAGALGNGIDRFFAGAVVDFLDFRLIQFPVFNIADVCINIGIFFLLLANFVRPSAQAKR